MWHIRKAQRMRCTPENTEVPDKSPGSVLYMAKRVHNAMEKIILQNSVPLNENPNQCIW